MSSVVALDHTLFLLINTVWTHPLLDELMPLITDLHKVGWFTKGIGPLLLVLFIFRERLRAIGVLFACILTFALTDSISHRLIKPMFERSRPFQTLEDQTQLRTNKHAGYSFPSNHAANMFGIAMILSCFFRRNRYLFFAIATLIAYSRVYVGVHFPVDVLAGAMIGLCVGRLVYFISLKSKRLLSRAFGSRSVFPDNPN